MRRTKFFLGSFFAGFVALLFCVGFVSADGMIIPPVGKVVHETEQKAVIFYDEGVEHLFLSITFQGDADNFAWIVPTPSQPEVGKSSDRVFTRLDELTKPEYPKAPHRQNSAWMGATMEDSAKSVTVLETKKIEYYDISVLEANNKDALYNWLNDHGYRFPQGGTHIIDEYIQKGWIFTAVKIDDQRFSATGGRQLQTGHAIPLKLSFKTDQIVYPLKISSITGMADDALVGEVTYIDGAVGKGVKLDTDRMMATDKVVSGFDITSGSTSFFLKKRDTKALGNVFKIEKVSADGRSKECLRMKNYGNNTYNFSLYAKGTNQTFTVDLGSDFKENEWQKFEFKWGVDPTDNKKFVTQFFIDNVERTLNSSGNQSQYSITNRIVGENSILSIGGEFYSLVQRELPVPGSGVVSIRGSNDYFINHTSDILIDEIKVVSNEKQIFSADFRDQLKIELANDNENSLRIFKRNVHGGLASQQPTGMGILLYIFADKKYEIPEFDTEFAGPISKESIENIAKIDGKTPWFEPAKNDYYLTRLHRYMDISEMNEDLYPEQSEDQGTFNYVGGEKTRLWFIAGLIFVSTVAVAFMIVLIVRNEKGAKRSGKTIGNDEKETDYKQNNK